MKEPADKTMRRELRLDIEAIRTDSLQRFGLVLMLVSIIPWGAFLEDTDRPWPLVVFASLTLAGLAIWLLHRRFPAVAQGLLLLGPTLSVALALRRADAALVGLGGDRIGDVIWGVSGRVGGYIGGVHACQIPTASSATGDIRSLLLMAGPGLRQGMRLKEMVHQWDVAPTLCHLLGWPMPAQAEGRVLHHVYA